MRNLYITLLSASLVLLSSCATIPQPNSSTHYKASFAGFGWTRGGGANAAIGLKRITSSPSKLYVKAFLPTPDGSGSTQVRKIDSGGKDDLIMIEGAKASGWITNKTYNFYVEVYSDSTYTTKIDSLSQPAVCIVPPMQ